MYFQQQSEEEGQSDTKQVVRKGIIWHQRDRLFSRWKERFFILTSDYFHCFKKDCSKLSEMGEFLFKASNSIQNQCRAVHCRESGPLISQWSCFQLKLTNIDGVSLLDKRGYLTICINQKADGRMYLRLQEGIRDWFYHLQSSVYESKRRRKFWVKGPTLGGGGGLGNNSLARLYGEKILH